MYLQAAPVKLIVCRMVLTLILVPLSNFARLLLEMGVEETHKLTLTITVPAMPQQHKYLTYKLLSWLPHIHTLTPIRSQMIGNLTRQVVMRIARPL